MTGWVRHDPEGYRCRIGAVWTRLLLRRGWAIVVCQTVWIREPLTWRSYLRNRVWRAHEHHHFVQERRFRNSFFYLAAFAWEYVRHGHHDRSPLEIEADQVAERDTNQETELSG